MTKLAVIAEDEKELHGYSEFSDNLKRVTINNRLGTELVCKPDKPSAASINEAKSKGGYVVWGEASKQVKRNDLVREAEPAQRRRIVFSNSDES